MLHVLLNVSLSVRYNFGHGTIILNEIRFKSNFRGSSLVFSCLMIQLFLISTHNEVKITKLESQNSNLNSNFISLL